MFASPLDATNSVDAAAVSEFESTALKKIKIGHAADSEEVTVGRVNFVSKAASASLA